MRNPIGLYIDSALASAGAGFFIAIFIVHCLFTIIIRTFYNLLLTKYLLFCNLSSLGEFFGRNAAIFY